MIPLPLTPATTTGLLLIISALLLGSAFSNSSKNISSKSPTAVCAEDVVLVLVFVAFAAFEAVRVTLFKLPPMRPGLALMAVVVVAAVVALFPASMASRPFTFVLCFLALESS